MLALLKTRFKRSDINKTPDKLDIDARPAPIEVPVVYDEDTLKKNIAAKLKGYQPLEKEANFRGPSYY